MTSKKDRDIGKEILQGIRQIKRGEIGRIVICTHRLPKHVHESAYLNPSLLVY